MNLDPMEGYAVEEKTISHGSGWCRRWTSSASPGGASAVSFKTALQALDREAERTRRGAWHEGRGASGAITTLRAVES